MIRHDVTRAQLERQIRAHDPRWFDKVREHLSKLPAAPTGKDYVSLWSDVKQVYIKLQGEKCAYCEMPVEGAISNDVEHYRPRARVSPWKVPAWLAKAGLSITPPVHPKGDPGYAGLAYEPWNYAASCKVCNSVLKRNLFPIRGMRQSDGTDPRRMKAESPLLIYPIGQLDANPEKLIRFVGMSPEPVAASGHPDYFRALATIELFRLDDANRRKALFASRARLIGHLHSHLETRASAPPGQVKDNAGEWIEVLLDSRSPHTNCLRCFARLHESAPAEAAREAELARRFLRGRSMGQPPL